MINLANYLFCSLWGKNLSDVPEARLKCKKGRSTKLVDLPYITFQAKIKT